MALESMKLQASAPPRYVVSQHGQAFATRARADQIRSEIDEVAQGCSEVLIDFEGVRSLSFSFADELFGMLAIRHAKAPAELRPVAIGLSAQAQRVLLGSLSQRGIPDDLSRSLVPR